MSSTTAAIDNAEPAPAVYHRDQRESRYLAAAESERVQMARGLACFLLVAFHVIGAQAGSGMHVTDDSGFRLFTNLLAYVRMPLFTFLSGFVYAYRPVQGGAERAFALKKLRRLGLPFLMATSLVYVGHLLAADRVVPALTDAWRVYLFPLDHLWFVSALLCIFALILILEPLRMLSTPRRWTSVFALAVAAYLLIPPARMDLLGINEVPYLLPYFLAGLAANRFRSAIFSSSSLYVLLTLLIVMQAAYSAYVLTQMHGSLDVTVSHTVTGLVIGIAAGVCALRWLPRVRAVQNIGTHSYAIYLYHPVFIGVARMLLKPVALLPQEQFWVGIVVGILGPVLLELAVTRMPLAQLLLVGTAKRGQPGHEPQLTDASVAP